MRTRASPAAAAACALLLLLCALSLDAAEGAASAGRTVLASRHSRIHSISEEGKATESDSREDSKTFEYMFHPLQGIAGGGTKVTFTLNKHFPENPSGQFWCKFGEKTVPSQSYFVTQGGSRAIICQIPFSHTEVL